MSKFSGQCDLYDTMMLFLECPSLNDVANELAAFEAFKKKTGGIIYRSQPIVVNEYNIEFVEKYCPPLSIEERKSTKKDGRYKSGEKEVISYAYFYFGEECTLEELNKKGVYIELPLPFNTIWELIPYYPYGANFGISPTKAHVSIGEKSFPLMRLEECAERGIDFTDHYHYRRKVLQEHYSEISDYLLKQEGEKL